MKVSSILLLVFLCQSSFGQDILPPEIQIKTALLAAPPEDQADANVWGYNNSGKMILLKQGNGKLVCLADDPNTKGIKVACYSKNLEPFMKRGRDLMAEGKTDAQKKEIREQEIKAGKLKMPEGSNMLYVLSGKDENYNKTTGELKDGNFRYVLYVPYATLESTGLPSKPAVPGMPWLMDPGTYEAHIMITPPAKK